MEVKKKQKADVFSRRGMFLNLGLVLSLGFVICAFQWRSYQESFDLGELQNYEDPIWLPPVTEQPPPPKPKIIQPKLIEVEEDELVDEIDPDMFDLSIDVSDKIEDPIIYEEEEEPEVTYFPGVIEKDPIPVGGMEAFNKFLKKNLKYPNQAKRMNVHGKVFVQFVVSKTGELTDIKVIKGIGMGCDEEALRVIKDHPKWEPGEQRGRPVNVRMVVPIFFVLN